MVISFGANLLVAVISLAIFAGYAHNKMSDVEILNGIVTGKQQVRVSCEHSYSCNCRQSCSGSGNSRTCSQVCDTCYEHSNDWDWDVHSSVGTFTINRVDRRGKDEPPRWTAVQTGEHASNENSYQNPLLADDSTLFITDKSVIGKYEGKLPKYPMPFDYYRYYRVIGNPVGVDKRGLNNYLNEYLKSNGVVKQLNILTVFTTEPEIYFEVLMSHWKGGKKNDVIMVYGIDNQGNVKWFKSNSYAKGMNNREMHTNLRQAVLGSKLSLDIIKEQTLTVHKKFVRLSTEEFEYKKQNIEIPTGLVIFVLILNLLASVGINLYMKENNL